MAFVVSTYAQRNPKGWKVTIDRGLKPEEVEIIEGAQEFFGVIASGDKKGENSYAITVKPEVISKLPVGKTIILEGAQLEPGVKEMCLADYYNSNRKAIEEDAKEDLDDARDGLKGLKFLSKNWIGAMSDIVQARKDLQKEKRITRKNMKKLRARLDQRTGVNCVYVYNYSPTGGSGGSTEEEEESDE